ncbi:MAG TPA: hypothetical protein HPP77_02690 [Candidatus Hydrogenedentes bacterium]|nr:hypothetical protein [Candidatus Hydrogenedentota bacterium]
MNDSGLETGGSKRAEEPPVVPPPLGGGAQPGAHTSGADEALATIVPYRNPYGLTAYYLGIFSIIPCLGLFLGITGLALGIAGVVYAKRHPEAKGKVHAWIGILVGGLFGLLNLVAIVVMLAASLLSPY